MKLFTLDDRLVERAAGRLASADGRAVSEVVSRVFGRRGCESVDRSLPSAPHRHRDPPHQTAEAIREVAAD